MVAQIEEGKRRRNKLQQLTGWVNPRLGLKERIRRLREFDHRQSESRVVEDAVLMYLPILERQLLPRQEEPTQRKSAVA